MPGRKSILALALLALAGASASAQTGFPYDRDLVFQGQPMRGSKRVPILTFSQDGRMQIDLWCKRGAGQATITDGKLAIAVGAMTDDPGCSPERAQADEDMLAALATVDGISLTGEFVTLTGPKPLRFRAAGN